MEYNWVFASPFFLMTNYRQILNKVVDFCFSIMFYENTTITSHAFDFLFFVFFLFLFEIVAKRNQFRLYCVAFCTYERNDTTKMKNINCNFFSWTEIVCKIYVNRQIETNFLLMQFLKECVCLFVCEWCSVSIDVLEINCDSFERLCDP